MSTVQTSFLSKEKEAVNSEGVEGSLKDYKNVTLNSSRCKKWGMSFLARRTSYTKHGSTEGMVGKQRVNNG